MHRGKSKGKGKAGIFRSVGGNLPPISSPVATSIRERWLGAAAVFPKAAVVCAEKRAAANSHGRAEARAGEPWWSRGRSTVGRSKEAITSAATGRHRMQTVRPAFEGGCDTPGNLKRRVETCSWRRLSMGACGITAAHCVTVTMHSHGCGAELRCVCTRVCVCMYLCMYVYIYTQFHNLYKYSADS